GAADWDGDGKVDYFVAGGSGLYVRAFLGNTLGSPVNTGISGSYVDRTDGNGDGLDDVIVGGVVYNHNNTDMVPDLATQFQDGFGVTYTVAYTNIARGHYTAGSGAAYPTEDVHRGRIVASTTATDGIGGAYSTDYQYFGAQGDREGRGFLGFD